jgi:hypothetical protein
LLPHHTPQRTVRGAPRRGSGRFRPFQAVSGRFRPILFCCRWPPCGCCFAFSSCPSDTSWRCATHTVFPLPVSTIRLLWVRGRLKWVGQVRIGTMKGYNVPDTILYLIYPCVCCCCTNTARGFPRWRAGATHTVFLLPVSTIRLLWVRGRLTWVGQGEQGQRRPRR